MCVIFYIFSYDSINPNTLVYITYKWLYSMENIESEKPTVATTGEVTPEEITKEEPAKTEE